ncbi:putative peptidoglycan-N-acetylglucosamine deacetylase [Psilocybe cubensis]|uniref:Peptidoglycan-N-acetylglucosamine deacetylase n=1 Tax=Psilocybe cubensis TaxID=181762 RepID=A0ACB8H8S6_PSICU|nr:putative peptidoglycan-N-acetylglucosamine deacetylase [Psilocybe cubensis]KAH9483589.1 putative peptidoglycan-N-acetylglucosamine deacetylase [Psilocybe cubensis]
MISLAALTTLCLAFLGTQALPTNSTLERRAATVYDIVNALDAAGAKGTFFVNGNNWGCIYDQANVDRVKYAYNHGHQLASHTWAHKDLNTLTWDQSEPSV